MTDIRFINKNGTSVDIATIRKRFANVNPQRTRHIWNAAMLGASYVREVIEELCGIEIVDSDAGFGFLQ